jgi:hypothetical protein
LLPKEIKTTDNDYELTITFREHSCDVAYVNGRELYHCAMLYDDLVEAIITVILSVKKDENAKI